MSPNEAQTVNRSPLQWLQGFSLLYFAQIKTKHLPKMTRTFAGIIGGKEPVCRWWSHWTTTNHLIQRRQYEELHRSVIFSGCVLWWSDRCHFTRRWSPPGAPWLPHIFIASKPSSNWCKWTPKLSLRSFWKGESMGWIAMLISWNGTWAGRERKDERRWR